MQNIEEIIKQLKRIGPSEGYKAESLRLILSAPQNPESRLSLNVFELFKFAAALGLTGMLIMISTTDMFPGLNARLLSPVLLSNLDEQKIQNEANQVDIKITVAEAKYYNDSVRKVAVALDETAQNGPSHLNSSILEKEMLDLDFNGQDSESIDELLNKLTM